MVDADLRPEGKSGPMVRSLESYAEYYRRWSLVWEAQALLRARPMAGDDELAADFVALIDPIRYPETLSEQDEREVRRVKARVESERLPRGADPARHLKLGRGGLSDVEWLAQLLQLQHAGRHPELRTTSTVEALEGAAAVGLLEAGDVVILLPGLAAREPDPVGQRDLDRPGFRCPAVVTPGPGSGGPLVRLRAGQRRSARGGLPEAEPAGPERVRTGLLRTMSAALPSRPATVGASGG